MQITTFMPLVPQQANNTAQFTGLSKRTLPNLVFIPPQEQVDSNKVNLTFVFVDPLITTNPSFNYRSSFLAIQNESVLVHHILLKSSSHINACH